MTSNGSFRKNGSQSPVGKGEVKNKGGEYVDLFSTFHSGLLREGIFNGLSLGIVCTRCSFGEGKFAVYFVWTFPS